MGEWQGEWIKGRESARWVGAVLGLRPGTSSQICFRRSAWLRMIFTRSLAGIGERAGDTACNVLFPLGSAVPCLLDA